MRFARCTFALAAFAAILLATSATAQTPITFSLDFRALGRHAAWYVALEKGLNPSTIKFTNIDPAARVGMLVSKKIPAIETFIMSKPGIEKAAPGDAQTFLFADHGLKLYSNGILAREDYLNANGEKVKGFVKASLEGWRDTIADPKAAAEIIAKHVKGLDPDVVLAEIGIVNDLVVTDQTRAKGLGSIDPAIMEASVALIARSIENGSKIAAKGVYDAGFLPQPPIKP